MPRVVALASPRAVIRRSAPPRGLAALLGIVAVVGLCWSLTLPPWQSPDEFSHYAYVESLATSFRLPGNLHRSIFSTDEASAIDAADASNGAFYPETVPPSWSRADYRAYLAEHTRAAVDRASGGGPSSASGNPPLYYLVAAAGYLLDGGGTAYGRLYAMRIEGVVWLLLTTLGAWLLAGETFGRRRLPQLITAAVAALLPMTAFMSTNVNPDALVITEWTFGLWLAARVVNHRARIADVATLAAVLAAAILTKSTSYALVPSALLAVAIGVARRPAGQRLSVLGGLVGSALLLAGPVGAWLAVSRSVGGTAISTVSAGGQPFSVREFLAYVWQFYLPRLSFMRRERLVVGLPLNTVWIDQGAGDFGWLVVGLPAWMLMTARVVLGLLTVSSVWLVSHLRSLPRLGLFAVDLLALFALLALLHVTEYRQSLAGSGAFLQGRYLLPVVSLLALAVGLIVARLPRSVRAPVVSLALIGLLAGQVISLASVLHAYYL